MKNFKQFSMFATLESIASDSTKPYPEFFNTTHEADTAKRIESATNQNAVVLGLFQRFSTLTPSECLAKFSDHLRLTPPPITSVRRAITTLTKRGNLVKLQSKRIVLYGVNEYVWKIK